MRLCAGLSGTEFALLARARTTSSGNGQLVPVREKGFLAFIVVMMRQSAEEKWSILLRSSE
jgi:hypothetical protein